MLHAFIGRKHWEWGRRGEGMKEIDLIVLGIKMKTDGTELSVLDLYRWIKEECGSLCVSA